MLKKLVSTRQIILILIISMVTLKVLFLPSLLAKDIGRDAYFFVLLMCVIDLVVLCLLLFIFYKNPDLSFVEILNKMFGKFLTKIIMFLFMLFFISKCCGIFQANFSYLNENLYSSLRWYTFAFPILITIFFIASFGVNSLSRLVEMFAPVVIVGFIICLFVGLFRADFSNLLPFMQKGFLSQFKQIFRYSFWFGDYILFVVFFGNIKQDKKQFSKIFISLSISILMVGLFLAVSYSLFSYNSVTHTNAISDTLQLLPSISDIGSFDWIMVLVWDICLFLYFTLNVLGAFYCFRMVFLKKYQMLSVFIILATVLTVCMLVSFDVIASVNIARNYLCYYSVVMQYITPFILFVFSFKIKRNTNQKTLKNYNKKLLKNKAFVAYNNYKISQKKLKNLSFLHTNFVKKGGQNNV